MRANDTSDRKAKRPARGRWMGLATWATLASAVACTPSPHSSPKRATLRGVDVSGCARRTRDGTCLVASDGVVRVLVRATAPATFGGDAGAIAGKTLATFDDARLYEITVPPDVRRVSIVARTEAGEEAEAVIDVEREATPEWAREGRARAERGDKEAALATYEAHFADASEGDAALAAGLAARIELARGHVDASVVRFREAIAKDVASGRASDAVDDALALAFALEERSHRYAEARAALEATEPLLPGYPDGQARAPYYWGVLASARGDRREALRRFREVERRATRLGLARLARQARGAIAIELDHLGRFEEALDLRRAQERELAASPDACGRVAVRSGMGFGLLMMARRDDDRARVTEARAVLDEARRESGCADTYLHATALGHLAFAALLADAPDEAATWLTLARARVPEPSRNESFFWRDLDARIALARKRPDDALAAYHELERRARAASLPAHVWSALTGQGAALESLGRPRDALSAYARAEEQVDDAELSIPIGEGRARFLVERDRSARAGIALLLAQGARSEAFAWARRARRRVLEGLAAGVFGDREGTTDRGRTDAALTRYVEERAALDDEAAADWKLSVHDLAAAEKRRAAREIALRSAVEELLSARAASRPGSMPPPPPPPQEGELLLLYRAAAHGFTAMAADELGVRVFHVPPVDRGTSPDDLARVLLAPARTAIARASRVRALMPGALAWIDLHALPYDGAPLIARVAVDYGLDLGAPARPTIDAPRAVVVGDPQRNLPEARAEAQAAADALARSGTRLDLLETNAATHAAVLTAVGAASLFHYAGHATYGGEDGWDSALPLAAGGHLSVADVLAMARVPGDVVLSGCRAAESAAASPGETLGIAQAFLVAGSEVVVAPTRDADDALSARFAAHLYDALLADPSRDLAAAARRAELRLRDDDPRADWSNLRILRR